MEQENPYIEEMVRNISTVCVFMALLIILVAISMFLGTTALFMKAHLASLHEISKNFDDKAVIPTIEGIVPAQAYIGTAQVSLMVHGTNFQPGSVVKYDETPLGTTYISNTQLHAVIPAPLLLQVNSHIIKVANTSIYHEGEQPSTGVQFNTVAQATPFISIFSVEPNTIPVRLPGNNEAKTINVLGYAFQPGAVVKLRDFTNVFDERGGFVRTEITDTPLPTTVAFNELTATIPATELRVARTRHIIAVNPSGTVSATNPNGTTSGALPLTITNPVPTLSSTVPSSVILSNLPQTEDDEDHVYISFEGTNYLASNLAFDEVGSTVYFDGVAVQTTVNSTTSLTARVPVEYFILARVADISVRNSGPGGGFSNIKEFPII